MSRLVDALQRYTGKQAIILCFILCALPVGLLSALITPPGQSPDEPKHLARAAALLHLGILAGRRIGIDVEAAPPQQPGLLTGLKVDSGIYLAAKAPTTEIAGRDVITAQDFLAIRAQPADHARMFTSAPNTATYFPAAYLPATLGLALGLACHAPPFACFLLARIFMLAAFLCLGWAALWVTAYGEAALLVVLIMPMTLFLAGSVTQDSVLIGMACLACACFTRNTHRARITALVLFSLFLMAKPPYILMLGAFLLPFFAPGLRTRLRDVSLACIPVAIWVALIVAFVVVPFGKQPYHPGPLYTGDRTVWMDHTNAAANLHILLSPPTRLITLPWDTLQYAGIQRWREMVGVLGALQIVLPDPYYRIWGLCGAVALVGLIFSRRPIFILPINMVVNFLFVSFLLCVTYWLLMIQFYLNWSNVGLDWIDGMQGRYSLPLLPFLLFAIPGFRWRFTLPPLLPALPAIALGIFDIGYIPMKLVWNFYLH